MADEIDFTQRNPDCALCPLSPHSKSKRSIAKTCCVWSKGNPSADIMLVGLGPGKKEDKDGKVFVGAAGGRLNTMLQTINLRMEDLYVTNAVKCMPPNHSPTSAEVRLCYSYLKAEIEAVKPKLIIVLGEVAWQSVQGRKLKEGMRKQIGKVFPVRKFPGINLMVAIHPAATLRNPYIGKAYARSWVAIRRFLDGDLLDLNDLGDYVICTDFKQAIRKLNELTSVFAFDCETGFDTSKVDLVAMRKLNKKMIEKLALRWDLPGFYMKSISFSPQPRSGFCIPWNCPDTPDVWTKEEQEYLSEWIRQLMANSKIAKVGHNINFDFHVVEECIDAKPDGPMHDTIMQHFLLWDYEPHNLEHIAWMETKIGNYTRAVEAVGGVQKANGTDLYMKNILDSDITMRLTTKFPPMILKDNLWKPYQELAMPALKALYRIENTGMPVDKVRWKELKIRCDKLYDEYRDKVVAHKVSKDVAALNKSGKFNPNSAPHIRKALYKVLGYEPPKYTTKSGEPGVDEEVLELFINTKGCDFSKVLLQYRKISKRKSTYIDGMLPMIAPDGCIHARYNLHIARSGRTSSDSPNLQNITKPWDEREYIAEILKQIDVREVFIPRPGYTMAEYDFNQHELRVLAMASRDPVLVDAYTSNPNKDVHSRTAADLCKGKYPDWDTYEKFLAAKKAGGIDLIGKIRRDAKIVNFGLAYGKGYKTLAKELGTDEVTAKDYHTKWWKLFSGVKVWKEMEELNLEAYGYTTSLTGWKRRFEYPKDWKAKREGINQIIQKTASDLMLMAIITLMATFDKYGFRTYICAEIHDAVIFMIKNEELETMKSLIPQIMCSPNVDFLHVPIAVDSKFGDRWSDLKE